MKLSNLYIDEKRNCKFHPGFNIILGKNRVQSSEEDPNIGFSDTNGLGKTVIVSCIKYVLGGDPGNNLESDYFSDKRFWVRLEVFIGDKTNVLIRPMNSNLKDEFAIVFEGSLAEHLKLLSQSKVEIENILTAADVNSLFRSEGGYRVFSKEEYKKHLSKEENVDYSKGNISFSSLLDFIIRDEKHGFSDPISRAGRQIWVQYRAAQYLFGLPYFVEEKASEIQDQISAKKSLINSKKSELALRSIKSIDKIENLKMQAQRRLNDIKKEIDSLSVIKNLEHVRKQYSDARLNLLESNQLIGQKEVYILNYQKNLEDLKNKAAALSELLEIDQFYQDLVGFFPEGIKSNFEEFSSFFNTVSIDRTEYYGDLIAQLRSELKVLKNKKSDLEKKVQELADSFKSTTLVRDVAALTSREDQIRLEIGDLNRLRDILVECETIDGEIDKLEKRRDALLKQGKVDEQNGRQNRSELIKIFQELVLEIYQTQDGILEFDYHQEKDTSIAGRTEILCSIPSQGSHGRTYGKVNIFDFVWFLRTRKPGEFNPEFLIHDGSYAKISKEVKFRMLKAIIERIGTEKQYIITLNEGEVQNLSDYEKYICCTLDGSNLYGKFLKEQF